MLQRTYSLEQGSPLDADLLLLTSLESSGVLEFVTIESACLQGLRVITNKPWRLGEIVLLSSPPEFHATAQIVYCRQLPNESYVIDMRLRTTPKGWMKSQDHRSPLVD